MSPEQLGPRPHNGAPMADRAMPRRQTGAIGKGVPVGLTIALLCLVTVAVVSHRCVRRLCSDAAAVEQTREVLAVLALVLSDTADARSAAHDFAIGGDAVHADDVEALAGRVEASLQRIGRLTRETGERPALEKLAEAIAAQFAFVRGLIAARREGGFDAVRARLASSESKRTHERVRNEVEALKRIEEGWLDRREARAQRSAVVTDLVVVSGSMLAFSFVGLALIAIRRDVERTAGRRIAEAYDAVAREKERLEFIFKVAPVGISYAFTDATGRRTRLVNEAHLTICGLTREEFDSPESFVRITHPDDRARQAELAAELAQGKIDRFDIDKRYVHPDGATVWVMLTFERRRHADGGYEDLSVVVDVTQRKQAEAELEKFFTVSLDFLTIAGSDGYFKRVNPTMTDVLGWSVEEFLGHPFLYFVHPDDQEATQREVDRQVVRGEKVLQFENRYRHKDGSWRRLSWRSVPDVGGLMYGAARDVTESHRAENAIRELNSQLRERAAQIEAANRELEAFSYSVSHDLRAPLRHIQGYVGMLVRDTGAHLPEKAQRYLDTIAKAAQEMGELIDNLLTFAKMGRVGLRLAVVDLNALVGETIADITAAHRERRIEWSVVALPAVQADPSLLKQVWVNLLDNAVKYTRPREVATIEIGTAGEEDRRIVIFVRDNGVGFEMKYAEKLFGVFQRLHRSDEFEGTGVGLANVQRIVLRHGGRVWADAKPDLGASFFFTLKLADGAAES